MAITIVSTPGAANANSFGELTDADAYNEATVDASLWADGDDDQKLAAIVQSTRLLCSSFRWTGQASSATQSLCWPRVGMLSRNGFVLAGDVIPVDLKNAWAELAKQLLAGGRTDDNDALRQKLKSVKAGPVELAWATTEKSGGTLTERNADLALQGPDYDYLWSAIPDAVRNLLVPSWYERKTLTKGFMFKTMGNR